MGLGVTIISLELDRDLLIILIATESGFIIPIGFNLDLNGPNINFFIFNFDLPSFLKEDCLKLTNWPINLLLIS